MRLAVQPSLRSFSVNRSFQMNLRPFNAPVPWSRCHVYARLWVQEVIFLFKFSSEISFLREIENVKANSTFP